MLVSSKYELRRCSFISSSSSFSATITNAEAAPLCITAYQIQPKTAQRFGIVWSCISTMMICAWTAMHPNPWKARWNRFRLMFWMIIAPEVVLALGGQAVFCRRRDKRRIEQKAFWCVFSSFMLGIRGLHALATRLSKVEEMHGHFFQMGGFTLIDPDQKDIDNLERCLPWITSRKIQGSTLIYPRSLLCR